MRAGERKKTDAKMKKLLSQLRYYMDKAGLTKTALSDFSGVDPATIIRIKSRRHPNIRLNTFLAYPFAEIDKAKRKAAKKMRIVDFGVGDPDLATQKEIQGALLAGLGGDGAHMYPSYTGEKEFRNSAARYIINRWRVKLDSNTEILALTGFRGLEGGYRFRGRRGDTSAPSRKLGLFARFPKTRNYLDKPPSLYILQYPQPANGITWIECVKRTMPVLY